MNSNEQSYESVLAQLDEKQPRLASALSQAEQYRIKHAAALLTGARFKGLDQLLRYLDDVAKAFKADEKFASIAFLVARGTAEIETAVEATLSGYVAVASDAMRGVMEIEHLLLCFSIEPKDIQKWLTCDEKERLGRLSPAAMRKTLHASRVPPYTENAESVDYKAHSQALHVNPFEFPLGRKGIRKEEGFADDAGFWEIFEHGRRLHLALRRLTSTLAPTSEAHRQAMRKLDDVEDAWERTRQMQGVYLALFQAAIDTATEHTVDD